MLSPSDKKLDVNQQSKLPGKFEQFGANALLKLRHMILNHVVAGPGIKVERIGEKTVVSVKGAGRGFQMSGIPIYKAASKAELDNTNIPHHALGFITEGATASAWYERNIDNTNWVGRTIWED